MQQQWILFGPRRVEVPDLVLGERFRLGVNTARVVVRDQHRVGRVTPASGLLGVDAQLGGAIGIALNRVGSGEQIALCHQVRVDVVVGDRAVLVRSGDTVDAKAPFGVVMSKRPPQPGSLDEQLEAGGLFERRVLRGGLVAGDGIGHVGIDVKGSDSRRPVARALLSPNRAPRKRRPVQPQQRRTLLRQIERHVAPPQRVARCVRNRVRQDRQDEGLGVPERVSRIAWPGQTLGGDRSPLRPGAGLQRVEQAEAKCLLQLGIAVDLDVRAVPEVVQVGALFGEETVPAGVLRLCQRCRDLIDDRRRRALAGPPIGDELDEPQGRSGHQVCGHEQTTDIVEHLPARRSAGRPVDDVVHRRRHRQPACAGRMCHHEPRVARTRELGAQRRGQRGRGAGIVLGGGQRLVGDELGLHDNGGLALEHLDFVENRRHRPLHERDQARGGNPHGAPGRRNPLQRAAQNSGAEVENPFVPAQRAVADVKRLVLHEQAKDLAVCDIDDRLASLGIAVAGLRIGQRPDLVEAGKIGAGQARRLALIEVSAQADVPVGEREQRLCLCEPLEVELGLA